MSLMGQTNPVKEMAVPIELLIKIKNVLWTLHAPVTRNQELEARKEARQLYDYLEEIV